MDSSSVRSAHANVDEYISTFPAEVQAVLQQVRQAVRKAAPDATEIISYRIPALRRHGVLVYFAAFRNHIGFYPPVRGDARLENEKGNLRFPLEEPMPLELIERLTRFRVKQDIANAAAKGRKVSPR
jgi:uncharacterized protein YdhG (YjbR/CyaY superfamily)